MRVSLLLLLANAPVQEERKALKPERKKRTESTYGGKDVGGVGDEHAGLADDISGVDA
jgi:hypothetical protein